MACDRYPVDPEAPRDVTRSRALFLLSVCFAVQVLPNRRAVETVNSAGNRPYRPGSSSTEAVMPESRKPPRRPCPDVSTPDPVTPRRIRRAFSMVCPTESHRFPGACCTGRADANAPRRAAPRRDITATTWRDETRGR